MGEANRRGTAEQRKAEAIKKKESVATKCNGSHGMTVRRPSRLASSALIAAIAAGLIASR